MFRKQLFFIICQILGSFCLSDVYFHKPYNVSRSTLSGIAEYRSALTLDWLAAEDHRQRELVAAYETEPPVPPRIVATECMLYSKPASGKVGRLMLELLKNLEGDESVIIIEMIQALVRSKLLVETSMLEAEPDLEALVKTPGVMMGEPHSTFPRILAMVWMAAGDPASIKKHGWCPLTKITKYLSITRPAQIAKHMRSIDPVISRARFLLEEFVQHVTPIHVYANKNNFEFGKKAQSDKKLMTSLKEKGQVKRPLRTTSRSISLVTVKSRNNHARGSRKGPITDATLGLPVLTDSDDTNEKVAARILKSDSKQRTYARSNDKQEIESMDCQNSASSIEISIFLITFVFVL